MATRKNFSVTLSKPGRNFGVWAGKTGGESTRDTSDYFPGAQQPARKLTSDPTTSDIVIRKMEDDLTDTDIAELYKDLNTDTEYACIVQRLKGADRTSGNPRSYRCIVVGVGPPETDGSSSDPAELQVTLSVFGLPTVAA